MSARALATLCKALIVVCALALAPTPAPAAETPSAWTIFPSGLDDRTEVEASLAGPWEFILEQDLPKGPGYATGEEIAAAPWPGSAPLKVPGCFTAQLLNKRDFVGRGWYRIKIPTADFPKDFPWLFLRFDGVARSSEIYVNGRLLKRHEFSYVGFEASLPEDIAQSGEPLLVAARVGNEIPERGIPDREWDGWWNHAGIFRDARVGACRRREALRFFPAEPVIFRSLARSPEGPSEGWNCFALPADLAARRGLRVWAELVETGGQGRVWRSEQKPGSGGAMLQVPADAAAWSPESPALHLLRYDLLDAEGEVVHRGEFRVGLRDIRIDGPRLLVNGQPTRFLGVSYHEVLPESGYAIPRERLRADLLDMKALGCNFLRTSHYPGHPYLMDLCDELGLAVWEEIPAWKTSPESLADPKVFSDWAEPYLRAMVERDRNRPSVFFWSVGNEFDTSDKRVRGYIERATAAVRGMDASRPVSYASDRRLRDICFDLADVVGVNEYFGWYYGESADLGPELDALIAKQPDKPILVTEFGAGAVAGLRERAGPEAKRDYSEPHQVEFLESHLGQIFHRQRAAHILGGCWWLYNDFDDPHRDGKHHPKPWHGVNLKGLVTRDRQPKPSREAFREQARQLGFLRGEAPPAQSAAR